MAAKSYHQLGEPNDKEKLTGNQSRCSFNTATTLEKWLALVLTVSVLAILGLAVYIGVDRANHHSKSKNTEETCTTQDCVAFAGEVAASLNTSIDPCDDFYNYSCGGFVATHIRPDDIGRLSSFSSLHAVNLQRLRQELANTPPSTNTAVGKVSQMYATCLDVTTIAAVGATPLLEFAEKMGGLPVVSPSWDGSVWNIDDVMIALQTLSPNAGLFSISVSQDQMDTERYLFHVYQGALGMGSKSYYHPSNTTTNMRYQTAYLKLMVSIFKDLGATEEKAMTTANQILELEKRLAEIHATLTELRDPHMTYNKWNVTALNERVPGIDWLKVLKGVLVEPGAADNVTASTEVIVQWEAYVNMTAMIFQDYPLAANKSLWANYFTWLAIKPVLKQMGGKLLQATETYSRETAGVEPKSRSRLCVQMADSAMGYATGRLFVDKYFSPETRDAASTMIGDIRQAFIENLPSVTWMDERTQSLAADKARAVGKLVGYANFIKNTTALDERYEALEVNESCHGCNYLASRLYHNQRNFAKLFKPVEIEWGMTPATVNAYYEAVDNTIAFPAGILQPTFYYSTGPLAMNYGGIGSVVGHELTHGFDDKGRQYDKNGNLVPWWSESSIAAFKTRAECIANQYGRYTVYGLPVNGHQTLGENIADHGGLKMAYKAFKKRVGETGTQRLPGLDLTSDQLFFVSFARAWCAVTAKSDAIARLRTDVHSPTNYRVVGTVSDDENFARAFNCKKGSRMNPHDQCLLW